MNDSTVQENDRAMHPAPAEAHAVETEPTDQIQNGGHAPGLTHEQLCVRVESLEQSLLALIKKNCLLIPALALVMLPLMGGCATQRSVTDKLLTVCGEISATPQIDVQTAAAKKACADVVPVLKALATPASVK